MLRLDSRSCSPALLIVCALALAACDSGTDTPIIDVTADRVDAVIVTDVVTDREAGRDAADSARDVSDAGDAEDAAAEDASDGDERDAAVPLDGCALTTCGGACVDTQRDTNHCGSCDTDCAALAGVDPARVQCVAGACVVTDACLAGRAHCSLNPADGCEADLRSAEHCGGCGSSCRDPLGTCASDDGGVSRCVSGCAGATPDRCASMCVSVRSNVAHCGACGNACNAPAHGAARCADGACGFTCDTGYHACGTQCAANTEVATCGASCAACAAPAHATATCDGTRCGFTCEPGFGDCNGTAADGCESDLNAPATCGACTTRCAEPSPLCGTNASGARACISGCSGATPTRCGMNCVDLTTDRRFCGGCTTACPDVLNGRSTCAAGRCGFVCDAGFHACGSACVSNSAVAACGASCTPCAAPANAVATCNGTTCGFTCNTGFHLCGSACVSNAAPATCGASCSPCAAPANATATCSGSACGFTCNTGYHLCAGACVSDASTASCGSSCTACPVPSNSTATCVARSCGFTCATGFHLCAGACVSNTAVTSCGASSCTSCAAPANGRATCDGTACGIACNTGYHACGGVCASDADPATCGTSCTACPTSTGSTATCTAGVCGLTCATNFGNCNGLASDGCEANLMTDAANCGMCGRSCGTWGVCSAGVCPGGPLTTGRAVVSQFGYDVARSGANRAESTLTPANVVSASFGRDTAFSTSLDAAVYAQPLYVPQVLVAGVRRDVLYAVTQSNAVYALNAATGATLWRTTFGVPSVPLSTMYCGNVDPLTGIVGTPVIDTASWTIFITAYTTTNGGDSKRFMLHALDIGTGTARPGYPVVLTPPAVGASTFNPEYTGERGAMSVLGGRLYIPFGGLYGDCGTYHGWVVGVDLLTPTRQTAYATPGSGSAVWAPAGFSADTAGRIYIATGNGFTTASRGETVFSLATGTSGPTLTDVTANYFVPSDQTSLDSGDVDLGSIAPIIVDHTGSSTPRLLFQSGKAGIGYLLNRDNLGGRGTGNGTTGEGLYSQAIFSGGVYGASATFTDASNTYVFVPGRGGRATPCTGSGGVMALRLRLSGTASAFSPAWCTASTSNSSSPSVSSNGTANGILWMATVSPATLRAYAISDGRELYISSGSDSPSSVRQWVPPVVADGRVYVTGNSAIYAYRNR